MKCGHCSKVVRATLMIVGGVFAVSLAAIGLYVAYIAKLWRRAMET